MTTPEIDTAFVEALRKLPRAARLAAYRALGPGELSRLVLGDAYVAGIVAEGLGAIALQHSGGDRAAAVALLEGAASRLREPAA